MNAKSVNKMYRVLAPIAGLSYLLAVMPRMFWRPERLPGKYYAHRGLHDNQSGAPENTMPAFRKAVEAGYGIELDIQLTKDGKVVVVHDFNLKRLCGIDKEVDQMTYEELQKLTILDSRERIPLFEDVLDLVDGRVPLIVELKVKDIKSRICQAADAILQEYHGVYCIESFAPNALLWYRFHRRRVYRGQLSSDFSNDDLHGIGYIIQQYLLANVFTAPDFIAYDYRHRTNLSKNICRWLYKCPSVAWTIRSQEQLDEAKKYYDYFIFEGFTPGDRISGIRRTV